MTGAACLANSITASDLSASLHQRPFEVDVQRFQALSVINHDRIAKTILAPAGIADDTASGGVNR